VERWSLRVMWTPPLSQRCCIHQPGNRLQNVWRIGTGGAAKLTCMTAKTTLAATRDVRNLAHASSVGIPHRRPHCVFYADMSRATSNALPRRTPSSRTRQDKHVVENTALACEHRKSNIDNHHSSARMRTRKSADHQHGHQIP
jgi:hypothetical protein